MSVTKQTPFFVYANSDGRKDHLFSVNAQLPLCGALQEALVIAGAARSATFELAHKHSQMENDESYYAPAYLLEAVEAILNATVDAIIRENAG